MKSTKRYVNIILTTIFCSSSHLPAMEPRKIPTTSKNKYEYTVSSKNKQKLESIIQDLRATITILDMILENSSLYEEKKITNAKKQKEIATRAITFAKAMSDGEIPVDWDRIEDLMRNLKAYPTIANQPLHNPIPQKIRIRQAL